MPSLKAQRSGRDGLPDAQHGFRLVDKSELPHKVWGDCIKCAKFPDCDENAMILDL